MAKGSSLDPLLADVSLTKLGNTTLKESIKSLTIYKRYVDDIFCVASHDQQTEAVLDRFNSAHSEAKFTIELESDDALAFLDVLIERKPTSLVQRRIHRKHRIYEAKAELSTVSG